MSIKLQRQSHLFGQSLRTPPKDAESVSHKYLAQAGFINQLASGIFSLLPLGYRVHKKIENIIREEMESLGAQEILLPSLQPRTLWEESGRFNSMDPPLFVVKDRHGKELALGSTHEEVITDLARNYLSTYKQLPVSIFQIQTKFRNEQRATGGLLRVREFVMKDLYSFHETEDDLVRFYGEVKQAYVRLFGRCGLEVIPIEAQSGTIGGAVSHEFALVAETGEDTVARCPECGYASNVEVTGEDKECPKCKTEMEFKSCIENGHIFQLGMKYSQAMHAEFTKSNGTKQPFIMGCYGIGVGRLLAGVVEASHDEKGIIWPASVAPFDIHLLSLRGGKEAEDMAKELSEKGMEVLFDDREDASAGEKFADSELIGIPVQVIVGEKGVKEGKIEVRQRAKLKEGTKVSISADEIINYYRKQTAR